MPFPAYVIQSGLLNEAECDALLGWAIGQADNFRASALKDRRVSTNYRNSRTLRKIGPWVPLFEERIGPLLPGLFDALGMPPFVPAKIELQMTAHNDGEYFKRHIDTRTGESDEATVRLISFVYYFAASPPRFGGGALRLHSFGPGSERSADIEPARNSLVAFPSWAPHEVLPVECRAGRFEDSRFAINGWVRRAKVPAAQ